MTCFRSIRLCLTARLIFQFITSTNTAANFMMAAIWRLDGGGVPHQPAEFHLPSTSCSKVGEKMDSLRISIRPALRRVGAESSTSPLNFIIRLLTSHSKINNHGSISAAFGPPRCLLELPNPTYTPSQNIYLARAPFESCDQTYILHSPSASSHLTEMHHNAVIRGSDFPSQKNSADISLCR